MKKGLLATLFILLFLHQYGQHPAYQYELSTDHRKIFLRESVTLTLKIIDPMIYKQVDHEKFIIPGEDYNLPQAPPYYSSFITITPKDTGMIQIGPYKIEYQGNKLTSNVVSLVVMRKINHDYLVFELPPKGIYLGNAEIKIRSKGIDISKVELKEKEFFHIKSRGNSTTTSTINEKKTVIYVRSFTVDFKKKGVLKLSKDDLLNLPEQAEIEPDSILIE